MIEPIQKIASLLLQHNDFYDGACIDMNTAMKSYLKDRYGVDIELHSGWLMQGDKKVPHMWSSYNGKLIDVTSHKQDGIEVDPIILEDDAGYRIESKDLPEHFIHHSTSEMFTEWLYDYLDHMLKSKV